MHRIATPWLLLAQRSPMDDLTSYFRGPRVRLGAGDALYLLLGVGGLILVLWLLSLLMTWQERGYRKPSAGRLFLSLCRAHHLGWTDAWLLWRLARSQRLRHPARVFLEPQRFAGAHLSRPLRRHAGRLDEMRKKLFAAPSDASHHDGRAPIRDLPPPERLGTPLRPVAPTPRLEL